MKEREAGRRAVPFGDQAAIFRFRTETIAHQIFFSGNHGFRFALVFGKPADKVEDQGCIVGRGFADGKHYLEVTAKDAKDAKGSEIGSIGKLQLTHVQIIRCPRPSGSGFELR